MIRKILKHLPMLTTLALIVVTTQVFADSDLSGIIVSNGEDASSKLTTFTTIMKTLQNLLFYGLAPLSGGALVYKGVKETGQAGRNDKETGVMMIVAGAVLVILGPVLKQIIEAMK